MRRADGSANGSKLRWLLRAILFLCVPVVCVCFFFVPAHAQTPESRILDRLHGDLNLTAAQENSWQAFKQAYVINPQEMAQRRIAVAAMPTLTAPQRMDRSVSLMKDDLASLMRRSAALKVFYSTLSPQQQGTFDRETLPY